MSNDSVFVEVMQRRLKNYSLQNEEICGYVEEHTYPELLDELRTLGYNYAIRRSELNKGNNAITFSYSHESANSPDVHFFGSPFISWKRTTLQCILGPNHRQSKKETETDHPTPKKKRFHVTNTKKIGCPAVILVKSIKVFNDYVVDENSPKEVRQDVLRKLKIELESDSPPQYHVRNYIKVMGNHIHSTTISEMNGRIHPALIEEIYKLVESGVTSTRDVEIYLRRFVDSFTEHRPNFNNKSFFPGREIIYYHIYMALAKLRESKIDQENLEKYIENWKQNSPEDEFYYRPYSEEGNLLFCHTTGWQKHLLQRYGSISLLDATYRTMKYALPLFFLCVKTNVGYTVVSTFIVQSEKKDAVIEALSVIKNWCPEWSPQFFMTDFSEVEIGALETVFPHSTVYLCAFHREQAWQRWLRKQENIENDGKEILSIWRAAAEAPTEQDLQENIEKLNILAAENPKASTYFSSQWLPHVHRWVACFSDKDFVTVITTNNGVESQNKVLKHSYLCHNIDKTLSGMLKMIIENYLPDAISKYTKKNSIIKMYHSDVPDYLHNRPHKFITHIMDRISSALSDVEFRHISEVTDGIFCVKSSSSNEYYQVNFDLASCSCRDFLKTRLPCKHFCSVMQHFPTYSFSRLPDNYINSPFLTLDPKFSFSIMETASTSGTQTLVSNSQSPQPESFSHTLAVPVEQSADIQQSELLRCQQQLRECCKYISDMSYVCTDVNYMKSCLASFQAMSLKMSQMVPSSSGLPLLPPEVIKQKSDDKYKQLPLRKKHKNT